MSQPLHADYARCHDGPGRCPMAERCRRTEPVPDGTVVSHSMLFSATRDQGSCRYFIDRGGPSVARPPSLGLAAAGVVAVLAIVALS